MPWVELRHDKCELPDPMKEELPESGSIWKCKTAGCGNLWMLTMNDVFTAWVEVIKQETYIQTDRIEIIETETEYDRKRRERHQLADDSYTHVGNGECDGWDSETPEERERRIKEEAEIRAHRYEQEAIAKYGEVEWQRMKEAREAQEACWIASELAAHERSQKMLYWKRKFKPFKSSLS